MNELEKLIADSIEARDAKIAEAEAAGLAEEARYDALFHSLLTEAIEAVKPQIPAPLHSYIRYNCNRPAKDELDSRNWRPTTFWIQNATGLDDIAFCVNWHEGRPKTYYIEGTSKNYEPDNWSAAIADASDRYRARRAEYSKAAMGL